MHRYSIICRKTGLCCVNSFPAELGLHGLLDHLTNQFWGDFRYFSDRGACVSYSNLLLPSLARD